MKLFIIILIAFLTVELEAAEWIASYQNDKFPGKCAITPSLILNQGVTIKDPMHECRQIVCGKDGVTLFQSCGYITGPPAFCYFGDYLDAKLPYPQCCQRSIICP